MPSTPRQTSNRKEDIIMNKTNSRGPRRIRVRGIRRQPVDLQRLARAIIELAQAEAEATARASHETDSAAEQPARRAA
jgi:hypothetical protein